MPDFASLHVNETETSELFQPAPFGAGEREPPIVGTVASRLIVTLTGPAEPPVLVAEHEYVVADWSAVTFWFTQPVFASDPGDSASATVQTSETLLRYQPLSPSGELGVST